jgi:hypothetical protein
MTFCFQGTYSPFMYSVRGGRDLQTLSAQILLLRIKCNANVAGCIASHYSGCVCVILSCPVIVMLYFYGDVSGILNNNTYSYVQISRLLEFETVSVSNRMSTFRVKFVLSSWREDILLEDEDTKLGHPSNKGRSVMFLETFFTAYLH